MISNQASGISGGDGRPHSLGTLILGKIRYGAGYSCLPKVQKKVINRPLDFIG